MVSSKRTIITASVVATSTLLPNSLVVAQAPIDDLGSAPIAPAAPAMSVPAATVRPASVKRPAPPPVIAAPTPPQTIRAEPIAPPKPAVPRQPAAPKPVKATPRAAQPFIPSQPPQNVNRTDDVLVVDGANAFIDRDDYQLGATEREKVQVEIITRGQPRRKAPVARSVPAKFPSYSTAKSRTSVKLGAVNLSRAGIRWRPRSNNAAGNAPAPASVISPGRAYLNRNLLKPLGNVTQKALQMAFPVAIPSPITSLFGWRIHPISGVQKLHTGTDIGAPMGTPVMAAMPGRVMLADSMGGYGLTVAIEHDNGMRQTLYAHMSELFVRPGDQVQQGTVIGRVGSTGASTGPHLHFELRQMMPDGTWVAMDAGEHLNKSMGSLLRSLQLAQQEQQPKTTAVQSNQPNPAVSKTN